MTASEDGRNPRGDEELHIRRTSSVQSVSVPVTCESSTRWSNVTKLKKSTANAEEPDNGL